MPPLTTWLLKSGIDTIAADPEKAGAMDGTRFSHILLRITLPLARPVIGTTLRFFALIVWDEFLYAMLFTSAGRAQTLTVVIANLASGRASDCGLLSAAGVIAAVPPAPVGLLLQCSRRSNPSISAAPPSMPRRSSASTRTAPPMG